MNFKLNLSHIRIIAVLVFTVLLLMGSINVGLYLRTAIETHRIRPSQQPCNYVNPQRVKYSILCTGIPMVQKMIFLAGQKHKKIIFKFLDTMGFMK